MGQLGQNERLEANALDGYILISDLSNLEMNQDSNASNDITWNSGILAAPNSESLDLFSVALHELGHILGFVSGTDRSTWVETIQDLFDLDPAFDAQMTSLFLSSFSDRSIFNELENLHNAKDAQLQSLATLNLASPLDLYRFSDFDRLAFPGGFPSYSRSYYTNSSSEPLLDPELSIFGSKYFSIYGGRVALAEFSTGQDTGLHGDSYQGSHWKLSTAGDTVMSPALAAGERNQVSLLGLRAFDVIGWDLAPSLL